LALHRDSPTKNQRGDEKDQEYDKENLRDPSGCTGDTTKAQEGGEKRQNQEKDHPT